MSCELRAIGHELRARRRVMGGLLALCCVFVARDAQAQSASLDLRRTPIPPPGSHRIVPGEVPVQMPPPCADTTIIYAYTDTLTDLHRPILIGFSYAARVPDGSWHADFIVGTTGAPVTSSIAVTKNGRPSDDERFRDLIEALRFQPASLGGCAVRFEGGMDLHAGGH